LKSDDRPLNFSALVMNQPNSGDPDDPKRWPTFAELVIRLHQEGILIHPDQLAEFLLRHGLPVDLCYVPDRLKPKAKIINSQYQGDMARLEDMNDPYWHPLVVPDSPNPD
jgi:hypothetical protein